MLKSLILIGSAAAGGAIVAGMLSGQLEKAEFSKGWKPEVKRGIGFGLTAASGALLFSVLSAVVK